MIITSLKELRPVPSTLQINHPISGEPAFDPDGNPITVTLVGPNSSQVFDETVAAARRRIEAGDKAQDPAYAVNERAAFIASAIIGWSSDAVFGVKFSKKAALEFVKDPENGPMIAQIEAHLLDRNNFFAK